MVVGLLGTYGSLLPDQAGVLAFVLAIAILLIGMVHRADLTGRPTGRAALLECEGRAAPSGGRATPRIIISSGRRPESPSVPLDTEDLVTGIWYVVGFVFAGILVRLRHDRAGVAAHPPDPRATQHKGYPYESGIDTYGDTHARFGISFYIYALMFVAFDIEVVFIFLWALIFRDLLLGGFVSMLIFVAILLVGLAYAWRKGVLTWR